MIFIPQIRSNKNNSRQQLLLKNLYLTIIGYCGPILLMILGLQLQLATYTYLQVLVWAVLVFATTVGIGIYLLRVKNFSPFVIAKINFLLIFSSFLTWCYGVGFTNELRVMMLFGGFTILIFMMFFKGQIYSLILSIALTITYLIISYYVIHYQQQSGDFKFEVFYAINFFYLSSFLTFSSKVFQQQRAEIRAEKIKAVLAQEIEIERTRRLEELLNDTKLKELEITHLNEILQVINSTLNLDQVMGAIMNALQDLMVFDQLGIWLIDKDSDSFKLQHIYGKGITEEHQAKIRLFNIPLANKNSIFSRISEDRSPIHIADTQSSSPELFDPADTKIHEVISSHGYLFYPLEVQRQVIGVIVFGQSKTVLLLKSNIDRIQRYVTQIATAINNASLYAKVRTQQWQLQIEINERKQAELKLNAAKETAEAANAAKSEFIANISHEIRTPMNAILGFSELLDKLIADPLQGEYISAIRSSGKSLLGLINDILDLSKIEAGKLDLRDNVFNPRSVFHEIEQIFSLKLLEKKLRFETVIDSSVPKALIMDETRLRQILVNLVGNAIKFTQKGKIRLTSRCLPLPNTKAVQLEIVVADTGIGIPKDQCEIIFDAFQQISDNKFKHEGTGLGLAITKRLVHRLGGEITVTSELGRGSVFSVTLTSVMVDKTTDEINSSSSPNAVATVLFKPAKLLVADDHEINRNLIKNYLLGQPFQIYEAANGQEALDLAEATKPEMILMDMQMPIVDGYTAIRALKNNPELCHIPILVITASLMLDKVKLLTEEVDACLLKPISQQELINTLRQFLEHENVLATANQSSIRQRRQIDSLSDANNDSETLPRLLKILSEKMLPAQKILLETFAIDDIDIFSLNLQELGRDYRVPVLRDWGKTLAAQVRIYDIEEMTATLQSFPILIDELTKLQNSQQVG